VDSNGNAQFTSNMTMWVPTALPTQRAAGLTIFPFWDDFRTDVTGGGIFVKTLGAAPHRTFIIEWRVATRSGGGTAAFELRLFEDSNSFDVVYGSHADPAAFKGTIGIQLSREGQTYTQFSRGAFPPPGTRLTFTPGCCPQLTFGGRLGENSVEYPGTSGQQAGVLNVTAPPSSCGTAKPTPNLLTTTARLYDAYTFTNTGPATCVRFRVASPCFSSLADLRVAAYLGSFEPANPRANYLGDAGGDADIMTFAVDVPANATVVLVVSSRSTTNICTQRYSVGVEGLPCRSLARSAVSRKLHGGVPYDVQLPLSGPSGVECRATGGTGDHQIVVNFASPVTLHGTPPVEILSGSGAIGSGGVPNAQAVSTSGSSVVIPLTNVANAQTLSLRLNSVTAGSITQSITIPVRFLWGDSSGNGIVNAADVGQAKAVSGVPLTLENFRADVNASGTINASDISIIKSQSGAAIPP
jgi:hypothetical protein